MAIMAVGACLLTGAYGPTDQVFLSVFCFSLFFYGEWVPTYPFSPDNGVCIFLIPAASASPSSSAVRGWLLRFFHMRRCSPSSFDVLKASVAHP